jgi:hypothetical protein
MSSAAEWGLPDWTDPAAYGATASWNEPRWRWEFTRRRPDYRADFDDHAAASYARAVELYKKFKPGGKERVLEPSDPGFTATMPGPLKYGLMGLPNPRISDQPFLVLCFQPAFGWATMGEGKEFLAGNFEGVNVDAPEGTVAVVFDLARLIAAQLDGWRSALEAWQILERERKGVRLKVIKRRQPRKKRPGLWLQYLRVLDGREAGATFKDIAEAVIVEKKKTVATAQAANAKWLAAQALQFNWPA